MTQAPLMLSVSGARGIVGSSMTPQVASAYAAAFAGHVLGGRRGTICIGRDTRPSGEALLDDAAAGLASAGARVVDLGVAATPTVAVVVTERTAAGGMMITASHNPAEWNGLKCISGEGMALSADAIDEVVRRFKDGGAPQEPEPRAAGETDPGGTDLHVQRVLAAIPAPAGTKGMKVLFDPNHGAGCAGGRMLLERLGCEVLGINDRPDGRFAHGLEPVEENLGDLCRAVAGSGAAAGFAVDPDADRLGVVDESGRFLGEECTLVLAARRWLDLGGAAPLVANLSTSRMIDDLAVRYPGTRVHRTPVGEANVARRMREIGAPIGGEGNGGVIVPGVCWVRDSLSAMALVLGLVAESGRPLSALAAEHARYVMVKHKIDLAGGRDRVTGAAEKIRARFPGGTVNTDDGVRVDLEDGWVHLRPSNTEPIIRVIAEAGTGPRARALIEEVSAAAGLGRRAHNATSDPKSL